jgi:formylglycine-generating enzyme required for sulfatase activity
MSAEQTVDVEALRAGEGGARFDRLEVSTDGAELQVRFDVAWDGSWGHLGEARGGNWDALWVFFKYSFSGKQTLLLTDEIAAALDAGDVSRFVEMVDAQLRTRPESFDDSGPSRGEMVVMPPGHWLTGEASLRTRKRGSAWILAHRHAAEMPVQELEIVKVPGRDGGRPQLVMATPSGWKHARVKAAGAPPAGACVEDTEDRRGVFLRRSLENAGGPGRVAFRDVRLQCQLGSLDMGRFSGKVRLWPFALEMVHVPEGPFWLGDPAPGARGAPQNCFYDVLTPPDAPNRAYRVDSEDPIEVGTGTRRPETRRMLSYSNVDDAGGVGDRSGPIPAAFPKGFRAFYVMKRQVSQGEYAAFINTLQGGEPWSYGQLLRFSYEGQDSYRNTIHIANRSFARVATRPGRPHNHMCWGDALAFAAWAGLRPLTELEYEKACRGPLPPVSGELSWGTTNLLAALVIVGDEDGSELVTGNCNIGNGTVALSGGDGGMGPVRDDAFAARGRSGEGGLYGGVHVFVTGEVGELRHEAMTGEREDTGLSYYGIAGLTGNLWEQCVTAGNKEGREFSGKHGTGELDRGEAPSKALGWPSPTGKGPSWRGGSWFTSPGRGPVAARPYGSGAPGYYLRAHDAGFRAARTAPAVAKGDTPTPPAEPEKA